MTAPWPLHNLEGKGPAALIVRHAERHPVRSIHDSLAIGLTEKGKEDAVRFGESIAGPTEVRLYHSPAVRCRETAMGIAEGLRSNGLRVIGTEERRSLCAPYLKDERVLIDADRLGHAFMRAWFEGRFDPRWLLPTPEAADMVLSPMISGLDSISENGLEIHVSHDWEIVLLREELLGVRYEDAGWVEYLDGLALTRAGSVYSASCPHGQGRFAFLEGRRQGADRRPGGSIGPPAGP
ncbi:MAG: histidine phosphatase family protein [Methanomassiliicoccus sp.]|nr:histidine phosphatase family protein [Methanomassiliicoccus sp.]